MGKEEHEMLSKLPEPDPNSEQCLLTSALAAKAAEWLKPGKDRQYQIKVLLREGTKYHSFEEVGPEPWAVYALPATV